MKKHELRAYDRDALSATLLPFDRCHRVAFIASCAERLTGFYAAFARQDHCGDLGSIENALHAMWRFTLGERSDDVKFVELRRPVVAAAPDPERLYRSPFTPNATDCVQITLNAIDVAEGDEGDLALDSAILAQSTVDMYLSLVNTPDFEPLTVDVLRGLNQIDFTFMPLFVAELEKQRDDLELLRSGIAIDEQVVAKLKGGFRGILPVARFGI